MAQATHPQVTPRPLLSSGRRGMTLTEILVVVVMVGIITAVALPRIDWRRYRINSEVRNVTMSLTYAERLAVTLQHDVLVTIDATNRGVRVHEDANNNGTVDGAERVTFTPLDLGITFQQGSAPPYGGYGGALTTILFRRDGTADQNGVIYLNSARGIATSTTPDARAIEIQRATGRATWYTYVSGRWVRGK